MAMRVLAFTGSEQTDIPQTYGQQGVRGDLRKRHMAAKITRFAGLQLVIQRCCVNGLHARFTGMASARRV